MDYRGAQQQHYFYETASIVIGATKSSGNLQPWEGFSYFEPQVLPASRKSGPLWAGVQDGAAEELSAVKPRRSEEYTYLLRVA